MTEKYIKIEQYLLGVPTLQRQSFARRVMKGEVTIYKPMYRQPTMQEVTLENVFVADVAEKTNLSPMVNFYHYGEYKPIIPWMFARRGNTNSVLGGIYYLTCYLQSNGKIVPKRYKSFSFWELYVKAEA